MVKKKVNISLGAFWLLGIFFNTNRHGLCPTDMKAYLYKWFKKFFREQIDEEIKQRIKESIDQIHEAYRFAQELDKRIREKNTPSR